MNASIYVNFATAGLTFILGILILTGVIFPGHLDSSKIMFGVVLIIYGVYRFVTTVSKIKQLRQEERKTKLWEEREKLLKNK